MSRKNVLAPFELIKAQSLTTSFNGPPTLILNADNISYQINVMTSNSTGTFAVQASDDFAQDINGNITNAGNWINLNLAGGTPTVAAGDTNILIDLNQLSFNAIRLSYTAGTPGTGTCNAWVTTRQVGG